jgi:DNA-binding winged helix-turn-helix (wHTH) protein/Tol biopolymer transport system component
MGPEAGQALERTPASAVTFGPFAFDARNGILSRHGTEIPLPPRVIGVLALLLARPGEVVPRQDLLDRVWKDAFVTDTSLAEAVSFLRQALGDDPQAPRYVQTVHRRGYRFVAPVVERIPEQDTGVIPHPSVYALPEPDSGVGPRTGIYPSIARELMPWSLALVATAIAIAALWQIARQPVLPVPAVARFEIRPSGSSSFDRRAPALAVSPDGRTIAWSACDGTPQICGLYVRALDRLEAPRLPGTDGAMAPFFSPDGRWLGFFADGKLKKIAIAGGAATTLADAPAPGGASWNVDGRIVFAGIPAGGLSIASDQGGGEATRLTTPRFDRGEVRHVWPSWLPDGRSVIFTVASSVEPGTAGQLAIVSLPSSSFHSLRTGVARAVPAGRGYLLLTSGHDVQGVTFDERTLTLTGGTDAVLDDLAAAEGAAQFAVSPSGTLVAETAAETEPRIAWQGQPDRALPSVARLSSLALSPDGTRAAGVIADGRGSDIWIAGLDTGALTRVTFGATNVSPVWSMDGRRVFFASRTDGAFHLVARDVKDRDTPQVLSAGAGHVFPTSASRDGRIAVTTALPSGRLAIAVVPAQGGEPRVLGEGLFDEVSAAFSPDGAWLAYASNESGRWEVFARRLSDGRRVAVSSEGGQHPVWSGDGRWIYFRDRGRMLRARFSPDREPRVTAPEVVFAQPGARAVGVTADGRVLVEQHPVTADRATVATEWLRELRQKLPPPIIAPR